MSKLFEAGARVRVAFVATVESHTAAGLDVAINGYDGITTFIPDEINDPGFVIEPVGAPTAPPVASDDREARKLALQLAVSAAMGSSGMSVEDVASCAELFLAFLTGGEA